MRTFKMIINPTKNKKDAAFCQYFKTNTADSKCMYNTANFYIRNTMTGLKKSPEERTHLETEVLHYVFTGIQKANEVIGQKNMKKKFAELNLSKVGGMNSAVIAFSIVSQEPFQYPTKEKWFLSYGTLDPLYPYTAAKQTEQHDRTHTNQYNNDTLTGFLKQIGTRIMPHDFQISVN